MAVIVDERRACQRCGLDGHPQEAEMLAGGDEGHGGEENEEARGKDGFRRVVEKEALLGVRARCAALPTEEAHRGKRDAEEQQARDAEEQHAQPVDGEPASQRGEPCGVQPEPRHQGGMRGGGDHQEDPAHPVGADEDGGKGGPAGIRISARIITVNPSGWRAVPSRCGRIPC